MKPNRKEHKQSVMKFILFIFFTFICLSSFPQLLTVNQAIDQALKTNYDILLVKNDSASYAIDYQYANGAFIPTLNGTSSKIWNNNSQRSNFQDGRKRQADVTSSNLNAAINLDWTLFDGLKMFATKSRLASLKEFGNMTLRLQIVNSVAAVITNYYNVVRQKQQLRAIDTLISINEERVKLAEKKLSVGLGSKPELLQAKVDLNAQKAERLVQETLIAQLREQLNQLTGVTIENEYEVTDSIPIDLTIKYETISKTIEAENPSLLAAKKSIEVAGYALKERKGEQWPIVQFNSAYNFGRQSNASVVNPEFQPLFNLNKGFNYGFSATIPILNNFNTRRLVKQAGLELDYQKTLYVAQRSRIDLGLNSTFKDYVHQKRALALEEENIGLAKENVTIALARFRQGVSTYIELREAQISLEDAYNRLIAARYNTKIAETELFRLKGDLNSLMALK
jgi:outer membrane protein